MCMPHHVSILQQGFLLQTMLVDQPKARGETAAADWWEKEWRERYVDVSQRWDRSDFEQSRHRIIMALGPQQDLPRLSGMDKWGMGMDKWGMELNFTMCR